MSLATRSQSATTFRQGPQNFVHNPTNSHIQRRGGRRRKPKIWPEEEFLEAEQGASSTPTSSVLYGDKHVSGIAGFAINKDDTTSSWLKYLKYQGNISIYFSSPRLHLITSICLILSVATILLIIRFSADHIPHFFDFSPFILRVFTFFLLVSTVCALVSLDIIQKRPQVARIWGYIAIYSCIGAFVLLTISVAVAAL